MDLKVTHLGGLMTAQHARKARVQSRTVAVTPQYARIKGAWQNNVATEQLGNLCFKATDNISV